MRPGHRIFQDPFLCGALAALLICAHSCESEDPAAVDRVGVVDPTGAPDFYLGPTSLEGNPEVRLDVWGHNLTVESDSVAAFDIVILNRSDHTIYPPAEFEVVDLAPEGVTVLNPDSRMFGASIIFFLNDHMGADNKLDPGEHTAGVRVRFGMPELTSFSLGILVRGRAFGRESISGVVFDDAVKDGEFDAAMEVGLPHEPVLLYAARGEGGPQDLVASTVTDRSGRYTFHELAAGVYSVTAHGPTGWESTSPNPLIVTLVEDPNGGVKPYDGADFGFSNPNPPDSSAIYHVNVGAEEGEREDDFVNPPSSSSHDYVLRVTEPVYVRAPVGAISGSQVWINGTLVWEVDCDRPSPGFDCSSPYPARFDFRIALPDGLIEVGKNHIRIVVDGWGEPFWIYSIWRLPATGAR